MPTFDLALEGPFDLAESIRFLRGFTPANAGAASDDNALTLGFLLDGNFAETAVTLRQDGERVLGELVLGDDAAAAERQVARMLSLDVDGRGFAAIGERDADAGRLIAAYPGFRPVCFPSPYEAALWGVLAQRTPMTVAARVKARLCEAHGRVVEVGGRTVRIVPPPARLLELDWFPGLSSEKMARVRAVAEAALDGRLDADRLRALPEERALDELAEIRGVGAWTAAHILYRGAAVADALPGEEPRVFRGAQLALDLDHVPSPRELAERAERWRPYRMWMAVLMAVHLARSGQWDDGAGVDRRGGSRRKKAAR